MSIVWLGHRYNDICLVVVTVGLFVVVVAGGYKRMCGLNLTESNIVFHENGVDT